MNQNDYEPTIQIFTFLHHLPVEMMTSALLGTGGGWEDDLRWCMWPYTNRVILHMPQLPSGLDSTLLRSALSDAIKILCAPSVHERALCPSSQDPRAQEDLSTWPVLAESLRSNSVHDKHHSNFIHSNCTRQHYTGQHMKGKREIEINEKWLLTANSVYLTLSVNCHFAKQITLSLCYTQGMSVPKSRTSHRRTHSHPQGWNPVPRTTSPGTRPFCFRSREPPAHLMSQNWRLPEVNGNSGHLWSNPQVVDDKTEIRREECDHGHRDRKKKSKKDRNWKKLARSRPRLMSYLYTLFIKFAGIFYSS